MPRQTSDEQAGALTPEQREERRNRVLKQMAALAKDPDFHRRSFRAKVGGQLVALLGRMGITAAQVARKSNISPSQLSRQLSGDHNLTLNSLHDIATAAGATVQVSFEPRHQAAKVVSAEPVYTELLMSHLAAKKAIMIRYSEIYEQVHQQQQLLSLSKTVDLTDYGPANDHSFQLQSVG